MKKYSLAEHLKDCSEHIKIPSGFTDCYTMPSTTELLIVAYERWLNDRDLLSMEDKK